jgi:serine/threonine-protein kinase
MPTSGELESRVRDGLASRYEVEREIGRGGMATVFLARDIAHDRHVAIKVLHSDVTAELAPDRFLREIHLLAKLQHPNILPLHDSGMVGGTPFYVMPFVAGESLRDRLKKDGKLDLPLALRINAEAAAALDYAHRQGVIHRDIKPENILLSDDHVIIADFGIARAAEYSAGDTLTQTSVVMGTPAYMSPEQASGDRQLDGRSDVYSLACVLFEMISGRIPFAGATPAALLASRFRHEAPRITQHEPKVPRRIERAISRALSLSPDARPKTAGEFTAMLGGEVAVKPSRSTGSALRYSAAVFAVLAVVAIAGARFFTRASQPARGTEINDASVAVLPFETVGGEKGDAYFAAGMTDELISALAGVRGLRVAARSSTLAAARMNASAKELGEKLNVRTLLSGTVRRQGDSLRVTADLTDAKGGFVIRSFKVDRPAGDVFAVQDEIARMITSALSVDLSSRGQRPVVRRATRDVKAHDLYLQGRVYQGAQDTVSWRRAISLFNQAIERDSLYAAPWAAIAVTYASFGMGNQAAVQPRRAFEQARIAAQRALSIDSTSAEAHASMSLVQMMYDYDWEGAQASLDKAHDLDPAYELAYLYRGFLLSWLGKFDEATASAREGLRLDPSAFALRRDINRTLLLGGHAAEAERNTRETLRRDSTNARTRMLLGQTLLVEGKIDEAIRELERSQSDLATPRGHAFLAGAYYRAGRTADARRLVDSLVAESDRTFIPAMDIAIAYAGLQDKDKALLWLERAYDDRTLRPFIRDQVFIFIRKEPRYRALLARMRLPEV